MEILLITILTTLASDVYLQSDETVKSRNNTEDMIECIKGHFIHTLQIGLSLFSVMAILYYKHISINNIVRYVGIITIIHIIIDILKCTLGKKIKDQYAFSIDQILHLITSIYICNNWGFTNTNIFPYIDEKLFYGALIFIIVFIYTVRCGELFMDLFMKETFGNVIIVSEEKSNNETVELRVAATEVEDEDIEEKAITEVEGKEKNILDPIGNDTGRYIGILERSIVLFLAVSNNYSSIALLLTGKSIARNKEFENKDFAVKFIVGTFLSILIGIIGGEMFKVIIKYFI